MDQSLKGMFPSSYGAPAMKKIEAVLREKRGSTQKSVPNKVFYECILKLTHST